MANRSAILARRTSAAGVLISDDAVDVHLVWPCLRSADDHEVRVEWTATLSCVDTPADRELLVERFGAIGDVTLSAVASHFENALSVAVRRTIETTSVDALLSGESDEAIRKQVEAEVRRAAFAIGLAIAPPFGLRLESPSRERDRRLTEVRTKLAALGETPRDPADLFRAAASADPTWSSPTPSLWLVAGLRLVRVDPTAPALGAPNPADMTTVDALGPLRSVRAARVDGDAILLVGTRDGVAAIDATSLRVLRTFRHPPAGDVGFNTAWFDADKRSIVGTHSRHGAVVWSWDEPATFVTADESASLDESTATTDIDVCGVPFAFGVDSAGRVTATDAAGTLTIPIGPTGLAARFLRTRAGYVAIVSPDRARVGLVDLARPEALAAELHVSAMIGNRVADICFA